MTWDWMLPLPRRPKYAARVSSKNREGFEERPPGLVAAAPAPPAETAAGPVPGRMVLQDEGGAQVTLDLYATGTRTPLARVQVGRDTLALYALDLLRAGLRR